MYNKLFGKILDSSIWLELTPTRIVWITLLAAMDQDGYAHFSAIGNLAARARVTKEEAHAAVDILEAPDPESEDQDNDGRRIERVPGGWIILNAKKYRDIVTAAESRRLNRERQKRHYDKTHNLTKPNVSLTQSNAEAYANIKDNGQQAGRFSEFWAAYPRKVKKKPAHDLWVRKRLDLICDEIIQDIHGRLTEDAQWRGGFIPHPTTYLSQERWNDEISTARPKP